MKVVQFNQSTKFLYLIENPAEGRQEKTELSSNLTYLFTILQ